MELLEENEIVTHNVTEARLYGNLIVLLPDEQSVAGIAGSVPSILETIDSAFATMDDLCAGLADAQLTQLLQEYESQYALVRDNISQVAALY